MKVLFIVLNAPERLEEVLEALVESGVSGATVLDSVGMGHILEGLPLFAGMKSLFRTARPSNKTVFSVIDDARAVDVMGRLEKLLAAEPGGGQGAGCAFTVPVERTAGIS
jgi:nitrogen regulatory protein P-II 1